MKLAVLGPGCWGLTIAKLLNDNFEDIVVWGRKQDLTPMLVNEKRVEKPLEIKLDNKRRQVEDLYDAMELSQITYTPEIKQRALELKQFNIKDMDALHLSFAESTDIDYFITTDRLLINASKRANLRIKVINPIEFIMEVI